MDYEQARKFVNDELQKKGSILGLNNIKNLMYQLGNPQDALKIVHIAGTNGKGSTSSYIAEILINAGYRVGRYTSPSVFEYLEIYKINNENMKESEYSECIEKVKSAIEVMIQKGMEEPTAFEIETAVAFLYFFEKNCDIVILETGLGGTFDATNVINRPLCSVITSISMDHMQFLGNSIAEIAENKAGIIKSNCKVISAVQEKSALDVIKAKSELCKSNLTVVNYATNCKFNINGTTFDYISKSGDVFNNIATQMLGTFQKDNISNAIETVLYLGNKDYKITRQNIYDGIKKAKWHGRFEKISDSPNIYFDGGHNPGAAVKINETIQLYFTNKKIVFIIGVLADKDYNKVLAITAGNADKIYTVTPNNARGLDGKELCKCALKYNKNVEYSKHFEDAIVKAKEDVGDDGVILIYGSLSFLSDIKKYV